MLSLDIIKFFLKHQVEVSFHVNKVLTLCKKSFYELIWSESINTPNTPHTYGVTFRK